MAATANKNTRELQKALEARFERIPGIVNVDPGLMRRGRFLDADVLVGLGTTPYYLGIRAGRIDNLERGPVLMRSWRFAVRADASTWWSFWEPEPEPGFHDLLALTKQDLAAIEGDLVPLMANLQYIKDLLVIPRRASGGSDDGRLH